MTGIEPITKRFLGNGLPTDILDSLCNFFYLSSILAKVFCNSKENEKWNFHKSIMTDASYSSIFMFCIRTNVKRRRFRTVVIFTFSKRFYSLCWKVDTVISFIGTIPKDDFFF